MKDTKTATKVNVGDKFKLIKGITFSQRFIAKGNDVFEVKKIVTLHNDKVLYLENKDGVSIEITENIMFNHFKPIETNNKNIWTEWRTISKNELYRIIDDFYNDYFIAEFITDFLTDNNGITLTTRNNGKKTDLCVAFTLGGTNYKIKSTSCCNKVDEYNEIQGIEVALIKMFPKIVTLLSKNYIEENY